MKTRLAYNVYRIHTHHPFTIARGSHDHYDIVLVRLTVDDYVGYGEASPSSRYGENTDTVVEEIRKLNMEEILKHADFSMERISHRLKRVLPAHASLRTAIECAVWDIWGKMLGKPLYQLFGGHREDTPVTSFTIGIDTPEIIRKKVREAGDYPLLKVKLGGGNDEEIIRALRAETDKLIRVDANEGWQKEEALKKAHWLKQENIEFIEQPLPANQLKNLQWLKQNSPLEIVADENCVNSFDIPRIAEAFHGINIKLMKCGGLLEALKMIHTARSLNLKIMLGCMIETSVAITAAAHLSPLVDWADLDGNVLIRNDPFNGVGLEKGKLILPELPGLGVTPKEDLPWKNVS